MKRPASFWCHQCERWTTVAEASADEADGPDDPGWYFCCSACGEDYLSGQCGFVVDRLGHCLRPGELGDCPEAAS